MTDFPRPAVDLAYAMLRSAQCGHLINPSARQIEATRDVIERTYDMPGNEAMVEIAKALGLKRCKCCKEK